MSKLSYIVSDIKEYVHVPFGKDRAILLRVKDIETRRGKRRIVNPVLYSQASPKRGRPFWVETPFIRKAEKAAFDNAVKGLKMKALQHMQ